MCINSPLPGMPPLQQQGALELGTIAKIVPHYLESPPLAHDSVSPTQSKASPHSSYAEAVKLSKKDAEKLAKKNDPVQKHHRDKAEEIAEFAVLGGMVLPVAGMSIAIAGVKFRDRLKGRPKDEEPEEPKGPEKRSSYRRG